jgi:hypothetical protein
MHRDAVGLRDGQVFDREINGWPETDWLQTKDQTKTLDAETQRGAETQS